MDDLADAVEKGSQALTNTVDSDPEYAGRLDLLRVILQSRYGRVGTMHNLETAIQLSRRAVKATPPDHPGLGGRLNNLGSHLRFTMSEEAFPLSLLLEKEASMRPSKERLKRRGKSQLLRSWVLPEAHARLLQVRGLSSDDNTSSPRDGQT